MVHHRRSAGARAPRTTRRLCSVRAGTSELGRRLRRRAAERQEGAACPACRSALGSARLAVRSGDEHRSRLVAGMGQPDRASDGRADRWLAPFEDPAGVRPALGPHAASPHTTPLGPQEPDAAVACSIVLGNPDPPAAVRSPRGHRRPPRAVRRIGCVGTRRRRSVGSHSWRARQRQLHPRRRRPVAADRLDDGGRRSSRTRPIRPAPRAGRRARRIPARSWTTHGPSCRHDDGRTALASEPPRSRPCPTSPFGLRGRRSRYRVGTPQHEARTPTRPILKLTCTAVGPRE